MVCPLHPPLHTMQPIRILLVEDDPELSATLAERFAEAGCQLSVASNGLDGARIARQGSFDIFILDRMLPGMDGLALLRDIRQAGVHTPVIYLTTMSGINDRVEGLEAGADDYLVKPFAFPELLARVRVLLRRGAPASTPTTRVCAGDIEMDLLRREVRRAGRSILLMPQEFQLLEYLVRNANVVVTRGMLLQNVWNIHFDPQTSVVESNISRLRAKINEGFDSDPIQTLRNVGYKFVAPV